MYSRDLKQNIEEKLESKENRRRITFDIVRKAPLGASEKSPAERQRKFKLFIFIWPSYGFVHS